MLIKAQVATNTQNVRFLSQCAHGHVWSWSIAPCEESNMRWWNVSSFSLEAEYTKVFKCPHRYKSAGLRPTWCWGVPTKISVCGRVERKVFLFCFGGLASEVCLSNLDTSCICWRYLGPIQIPILCNYISWLCVLLIQNILINFCLSTEPQHLTWRSCHFIWYWTVGNLTDFTRRFWNIWRCVYRASYCNVLMTNEMHNSYNQFLFHSFCLLYMFRTNLVVHQQEHGIIQGD